MVAGQFLTDQLLKISGKQTSKVQTYYHCCMCFVFVMPSWLLDHSTPHLWTRFSEKGFKTFLGGGCVSNFDNWNISERYRKNIPISEGQGGKTMLIPLILFFLKGRSQLTSSIGRGGGGGECCGY